MILKNQERNFMSALQTFSIMRRIILEYNPLWTAERCTRKLTGSPQPAPPPNLTSGHPPTSSGHPLMTQKSKQDPNTVRKDNVHKQIQIMYY